nr:MAG TPA: hypothetical protein [Caudoviricetes sp.]
MPAAQSTATRKKGHSGSASASISVVRTHSS